MTLLSSCSGLAPASPTPTLTPTVTETPVPSSTPEPTATETPTLTPLPPFEVSSPLDQITFDQLDEIITQPFEMPHPRLDDGHHGVDLSFYTFGNLGFIEGLPIHAVFSGKVAAVVNNRNPYGNMIMIETPLEEFPADLLALLPIPAVEPTVVTDGRLSCPESGPSPTFSDPEHRSLYVLYGHMQNPPELQVGDSVESGDILGAVGNTGHSSNAHLHLETRVGPAGAVFTTIAHKDTSATPEEMYNYCVWRISNQFELMDPMNVLHAIKP